MSSAPRWTIWHALFITLLDPRSALSIAGRAEWINSLPIVTLQFQKTKIERSFLTFLSCSPCFFIKNFSSLRASRAWSRVKKTAILFRLSFRKWNDFSIGIGVTLSETAILTMNLVQFIQVIFKVCDLPK